MPQITDLNHIAIPEADYFKTARDWADDRYQTVMNKARRWFIAFWVQTLCVVALAGSLLIVLPLQQFIPLIIHQNHLTGEVWVEQPKRWTLQTNQALIESDLVRYVIARETVASADNQSRQRHILLRTAEKLLPDYNHQQLALTQQLKKQKQTSTVRKIQVQDVIFLGDPTVNGKDTRVLAKVDFITETITPTSKQRQAWVATLSWEYRGTPKGKASAWDNWNGFVVTYYRVDQRNVSLA